ncbi:hypothetical protein GE09DRAFT_680680 [Coniochaeta sp. 2T2.1]|nr:hypothetical protein GE09DRAFT_680680 [Coniochaeta sp. 2T2.1]
MEVSPPPCLIEKNADSSFPISCVSPNSNPVASLSFHPFFLPDTLVLSFGLIFGICISLSLAISVSASISESRTPHKLYVTALALVTIDVICTFRKLTCIQIHLLALRLSSTPATHNNWPVLPVLQVPSSTRLSVLASRRGRRLSICLGPASYKSNLSAGAPSETKNQQEQLGTASSKPTQHFPFAFCLSTHKEVRRLQNTFQPTPPLLSRIQNPCLFQKLTKRK